MKLHGRVSSIISLLAAPKSLTRSCGRLTDTTDEADITICNGVFIYLNNVNILEEFVRTCKSDGKCLLMFREDVDPAWAEKREEMEAEGKWR